jgi:lysophospholipase L1-like esterase
MKGLKLHAKTEKILSLAVFGILIIAGVGQLVLILQDNKVLAREEEAASMISSENTEMKSDETSSMDERTDESHESFLNHSESSKDVKEDGKEQSSYTESSEKSEEQSMEESSKEKSSVENSSKEESSEEQSSQEESSEESSESSASSGELVMGSVDDDYFSDALFIGDSRIVGLSEYGTIRNATYYAEIGISNAGLLSSGALPGVLSARSYGKIYLCCGINNIGMGADTCFSDFQDILDLVRTYQPDAIVYVMSNVYVTPEYWSEHPAFNNDEIRAYNYLLATLDDGDRTVFLNIAGLFESEAGFLDYEWTFDGIHLVADGYETWSYYLKNHAMIQAE